MLSPPFAPGERLAYTLHDELGTVVAEGFLSVSDSGGDLLLQQEFVAKGAAEGAEPGRDTIEVVVDPAAFKPSRGSRVIAEPGTGESSAVERYEWRYRSEDGESQLEVARIRDGKAEEDNLRLREHHYDNESALWLWRALDLAEGYEASYVSVSATDGAQQTVDLRVTQRESVEVPAGRFDTWRLQVRTGRATGVAWINVEAPHEIVQWDNGRVIFRLAAE